MLTQVEADTQIAMCKLFVNPKIINFNPGCNLSYKLIGEDQREQFKLDLWRGSIRMSKKMQTRVRNCIVLVRLEINRSPHTNPDGEMISGTHIHIYKEGYEDRWAYPLNTDDFKDPSNIWQSFIDFCSYCNISNPPPIQEELL